MRVTFLYKIRCCKIYPEQHSKEVVLDSGVWGQALCSAAVFRKRNCQLKHSLSVILMHTEGEVCKKGVSSSF